jgi:hypothetical protein
MQRALNVVHHALANSGHYAPLVLRNRRKERMRIAQNMTGRIFPNRTGFAIFRHNTSLADVSVFTAYTCTPYKQHMNGLL